MLFATSLIPQTTTNIINGEYVFLNSDGKNLFLYVQQKLNLYNNSPKIQSENKQKEDLEKTFNYNEVHRINLKNRIKINIQNNEYKIAQELYDKYRVNYIQDSEDYLNVGLIKCGLGKIDEGIKDFNRSLFLNVENIYTLNSKGYYLIEKNNYDDALELLDKAISLKEDFDAPYNNKGYIYLKLGRFEEAKKLIGKALILNYKSSYAYRNMGIYYLLINQKELAKEYFQKSYNLNKKTPLLDELLFKANS